MILEYIRLVQYFTFDKLEILLRDITSIFGPNGSGKSALLDAIQIAFFGANSNRISLNAQTEAKKQSRSIRSYCLGQYGPNPEHRVRDHATTYITMIWRNTDTNEPISAGVCIGASVDSDKLEVYGRFILQGAEIAMSDLVDIVDGEERPREWPVFQRQLIERAKMAGSDDPIYDAPDKYLRALLFALRATGGGPAPALEAVSRALRFGLRLRFEKSVDDIIRDEVLEAHSTNISKFKEIMDSFKQLTNTVTRVETQIKDGEETIEHFKRAAGEVRNIATWRVLEKDAMHEHDGELLSEAQIKRCQAEDAHEELVDKLATTEQSLLTAKANADSYRHQKESHSAHKEHGVLQAELNRAEQTQQARLSVISKNVTEIRKAFANAAESPYLQGLKEELNEAVLDLDKAERNLSKVEWKDIEAALRPTLKTGSDAVRTLYRIDSDLKRDLDVATEQKNVMEANLQRIQQGKAAISDATDKLIRELHDNGISPEPICNLTRISDPAWQPIIESYLGRNAEALLIPSDNKQEERAFSHYRSLTGQRAIYGVKMVMESCQHIDRNPPRGSVAELIDGKHPAAVAYLRRQFGNMMRAETDDEALKGPHTLTKDGMLVVYGEVDRLRPLPATSFKIGGGSISNRDAIQRELAEIRVTIHRLNEKHAEIRALIQTLEATNNPSLLNTLHQYWTEMSSAKEVQASLSNQLAGMADEEYVNLFNQESHWNKTASDIQIVVSQLNRQIGVGENALNVAKDLESRMTRLLNDAKTECEKAESDPDYDREYAQQQWDRLLPKFGSGKFVDMARECEDRKESAQRRLQTHTNLGMQCAAEFTMNHKEVRSQEQSMDWRLAYQWIDAIIKRLRDTTLIEYKQQMQEAYRRSQETFRNDVAISLNNNLEMMQERFDTLNAVLRESPSFSNGERYHFVRNVRPELANLMRFIKNVAAYGPNDDMFGGPGEIPEEFKRLIDDKITPGTEKMRSPLDDYREFFSFDIEILRDDHTGTPRHIGYLSSRIGAGSGGEHRSPLYVIAGAALASAYRLNKKNRSGVRLMLLDEVFIRMYDDNIIATMQYLEDLGLQIVMTGTGDNQGTLSSFMHRQYDIMRDPTNNTSLVEGHDISQEMRDAMRGDLLEFNPGMLEAELITMRPSETTVEAAI